MQLVERIRIECERVGVGVEQRRHERLRATLAEPVTVEPDRSAAVLRVQLLRVLPLRLGDWFRSCLLQSGCDRGANLSNRNALDGLDLRRLKRIVDLAARLATRRFESNLVACGRGKHECDKHWRQRQYG